MPLWHLLVLAALQGVTEFLPVSSSGHLILLPALTGLADQGTFLDVAVHVGTLGAVVLYFRADVAAALRGTVGLFRMRSGPDERLALGLAIATVPVIIAGLVISLTIGTEALRSVALIGWTTLLFGLLLWWCDQKGAQVKTVADWTPMQAVKFGLWQAIALIPGTSRSGIVITGARAMGYERREAARLSMLMSIPTILASGALLSLEAMEDASGALARDGAIAALFAFGAAFAALHLMMKLLNSVDFTPYVWYRMVLGIGLLVYAYGYAGT
ncbi:undecaprenyl-diphosphate phosphatase [Jannaschia formosa]|uniref:undecaprenyl-diphosphate phosphatase n=1 Tax=Jannaschia formosa TaxID=2259592 RepID=UPI000E1BB733|nr:undecaprenyl-diphosphate phosphatase [Jannaschia formosa]TFL18125.1 undecaprenyl-diphosphate phosphatase [Jannaschia formosa]